MKTFLVRRLLQSLVVLLGVSFVVFFILFLTGDPAEVQSLDSGAQPHEAWFLVRAASPSTEGVS